MAAGSTATKNGTVRLQIFAAILLVWAIIIAARLVQLQVFRYGFFVRQAARQQQRTASVAPRRGIIYDRKGQELAMTVPVDSVFAVPSEIPDQATTASILAQVLGADPQDLLAHIKAQRNFAWIARKLDAETANRIRSLNLRGIYFQKESKRFYPKRELAAQVLGYVGMDDSGLAGIEHQFDDQLRGNDGQMIITQDARRKWFGRIEKQPDPGQNVVLTIDEKIQYIAEKELEAAMQETQAVAGTIVVQNPRTGEILALANRPTFNPNLSREIKPLSLKNHAVSDAYEPGSAFKTMTYSSVLEEHLARPDETVTCDVGGIVVGGHKIHDSHKVGTVSVEQAFAESSNVCAAKMGLRLGPERLYKYIKAYGFGQQTGIELPGETRGLVKPPARWSGASIGSMAMGQEVGVTPLQMISMVSTIANGGMYTPPRIVAAVTAPQQGYQQIVFHPAEQHRVISTMTAAQMRRMMEQVVLDGTARRAILDGYTSAGKTGTAQKIDPRTHTYSKTDYVGSFIGFAPVNNPAITIAVILDSARGLHQGGQVSAPVFKRVAEQVLAYLDVPRDVESKNDYMRQLLRARANERDMEEVNPHQAGETIELAEADPTPAVPVAPQPAKGIVPAAVKTSTPIVATSTPVPPEQETPRAPSTGTVVLDVSDGQPVPSFVGKTLREAVALAAQSGFELQVIGSGVAREQHPAAGTRMPSGSKIAVRFSR
jgi:cell division protein FtsI (penicillin-binding protein 3)